MSEYARTTNNVPTLLQPVIYFRVSAWALALVALLGFVLNAMNQGNALSFGNTFLNFTWAHDIVHTVLAAAAFLFGYATLPGRTVRIFAIIFGVVYAGLGVAGFFTLTASSGDAFLALTPGVNVVHLALGGYALIGGIMSKY